MKRGLWTPLLVGALPIAALGAHALQGCYSVIPNDGLVDAGPPPKVDSSFDAGKESGYVGYGSTVCNSAPGVLPDPNCHVPPPIAGGKYSCPAMSSACTITGGASCGEPLCLPMANNSTAVKDFRMEALYVGAPPKLASVFLQNAVVTSAVTLNATTCGYGTTMGLSAAGNGLFNWLISVDTMKKTLTTGGAPFSMDPYKDGYCFANGTVTPDGGSPVTVAPLKDQPIKLTGNTFTLGPLASTLGIPIFTASAPGTAPIILPIDGVQVKATMSSDGNCIGDINHDWYANAGGGAAGCQDNAPGSCPKWFTNGSLAGYITLAEADNVCVDILGQSLCVLLTGDTTPVDCAVCPPNPMTGPAKCCSPASKKNGDYCSTPKPGGSATGCTDSYWLAATFAANAAKIAPLTAPCKP